VATYVYPDHAESRRPVPRLISPLRWDYVRQQMHVRVPILIAGLTTSSGQKAVARLRRERPGRGRSCLATNDYDCG
jgi:hypothetical protein